MRFITTSTAVFAMLAGVLAAPTNGEVEVRELEARHCPIGTIHNNGICSAVEVRDLEARHCPIGTISNNGICSKDIEVRDIEARHCPIGTIQNNGICSSG
jgi:hypothetical protein